MHDENRDDKGLVDRLKDELGNILGGGEESPGEGTLPDDALRQAEGRMGAGAEDPLIGSGTVSYGDQGIQERQAEDPQAADQQEAGPDPLTSP